MTPSHTELPLRTYNEIVRQVRYPVWQNLRLKWPLYKDLL